MEEHWKKMELNILYTFSIFFLESISRIPVTCPLDIIGPAGGRCSSALEHFTVRGFGFRVSGVAWQVDVRRARNGTESLQAAGSGDIFLISRSERRGF